MNEHLRLPPRSQLARPSRELARRMDALFASAETRASRARDVRPLWYALFASIGLAAALVLVLGSPWRAGPRHQEPESVELRTLPADLAATLLPYDSYDPEYSLSVRSY